MLSMTLMESNRQTHCDVTTHTLGAFNILHFQTLYNLTMQCMTVFWVSCVHDFFTELVDILTTWHIQSRIQSDIYIEVLHKLYKPSKQSR